MGGEKVVEVTMDRRNFAKRISELPKMIEQVDTLFKALPFPVEISMKK